MNRKAKATVTITAEDRTSRALGSASRGFSRLEKRMKKSLGRGLDNAVSGSLNKLKRLSVGLAAVGVAAGLVFAADSVRKFSDFESSMNGIEAVLKPTTKQLGGLSKEAKRLGSTTKFSARETASAVEVLAKNGVKTEEILGGMLESSLKLSASLGSDLAESADLLTDSMSIFALETAQAEAAVDSINAVTINSKFGFEDYAQALANGGASAVAAGQTFEEFNTAITSTASFFADGATAGTSYKAFMDSLTKDTKKAKAAQKILGLTLKDNKGNFTSTAELAGQLERAFDRLNPAERAKAFGDLFDKRGKSFAIGLARAGTEGVKAAAFLRQFASATAQAEKRMEGTQGAALRFKSAMEGLQLAIGGPLAKAATPFIDAFAISLGGLTADAENSEGAIAEFFKNSIINGAAFLDTIANIGEFFGDLVLTARSGAADISTALAKIAFAKELGKRTLGLGSDERVKQLASELLAQEKISAELGRQSFIASRSKRNGDEFTVEAIKIAATAEKLSAARARLRDEEAKFLDLAAVRQQAGVKGAANEEEIIAVERAVKAQAARVQAEKDSISIIKGVNIEAEVEARRSAESKLQISLKAQEAERSALDAERELRLERAKLATLNREGREDPGNNEVAEQIAAQEKIVQAKKKTSQEAAKSAQEIIKSENEISASAKITADKFGELATAAGVSSGRIVTAFASMTSQSGQHFKTLIGQLGSVQSALSQTTAAGEDFYDKAVKNCWLKDMALEGVGFLQQLITGGLDPLEKKLGVITKVGETVSGAARSAMKENEAGKALNAFDDKQYENEIPVPDYLPAPSGFDGGFGFDGVGILPGQKELEQTRSFYDQRIALLQEKGLEETEIAKSLEMAKVEALSQIQSMQLSGYSAMFSQAAGLAQSFGGQQKGIYKALFLTSKAFALAEAIQFGKLAVAKAAASALPPANAIPIALAKVQSGLNIAGIIANNPSFDGGGFTGTGARSGGVDGKGGFNAVLHPNETVIDHTKNQNSGGGGGSVTLNLTINGDPNPMVVEQIREQSANLALNMLADRNRRKGSRARALTSS